MAFTKDNLVGNINQGVYGYGTADTKAVVVGAGYFNEAALALNENDSIIALCGDGVLILRVSAVTNFPEAVTVVKTMEG